MGLLVKMLLDTVNMGLDQVLSDLESEGYTAQPFVISGLCRQCAAPQGIESGLWQTPVADDGVQRKAGKFNSRGEPKLSAQVLLPTPLANSYSGACHSNNKQGDMNLQTFVKFRMPPMWNTPTAQDYKKRGPNSRQQGLSNQVLWATPRASEYKDTGPVGSKSHEHMLNRNYLCALGERCITTQWETEPAVGRVADGIPDRVDRIRSLGNAVVPQIPEIIGQCHHGHRIRK